jgi:hypothetical protein
MPVAGAKKPGMIPNMLSSLRCLRFSLLALLALLGMNGAQAVVVRAVGFDLIVDGQRFVIKGVNYSPVPTGARPQDPPFGDYFVPNYANVWKPDLDALRAAGVNVIRLYAGDPALNAGSPGSAGNWKDFLDYAYNGGVKPVYVIMFSYTQGNVIAAGGDGYRQYLRDYAQLVRSTVTHPAVFGYCVGNEIFGGLAGSDRFWNNYGKLLDAATAAGRTQGRDPFLITATVDNFTPQTQWPVIIRGEQSNQLANLDAWGINIYRGPNLGGPGNLPFPQYQRIANTLNFRKPLILTEFGTPHTTRPAGVYGQNVTTPIFNLDDVPEDQMGPGKPFFAAITTTNFITSLWNAITANVGAGNDQVCVGGFIFDWSDEYWKGAGGNPNVQVGGPNVNFLGGAFAGGYGDEAGYGLTSSVPNSQYGGGQPNIVRTFFKAYNAVTTLYNASSPTGTELY